ncbi:cyclin t-like [Tropilaelaps mercedesae]|uniref:Cyclin t-like n=1 Tax=Tropilaelaps mercedesae TaxID=418985 RepID=A0A1V9XNU8_9ACAR|nr:cyclin t-like [Tropilaelaps mercedesae]
MCLQYKPTVVACLCIYMACKWTSWQIPQSNEGKEWFNYIDDTVTKQLLEELMTEFLACLDKCPEKTRTRIMGCIRSPNNSSAATSSSHRSSSGTHSSGTAGQGERTHQQASHHQGSQRPPDHSGRSRQHSSNSNSHQPDSTTLLADRRKTVPTPSHQLGVQTAQMGSQRSLGQHHGHPSGIQAQDRYSYNKEHQRQQGGPGLGHPGTILTGRHSLPASSGASLGSSKPPGSGMSASGSSSTIGMQLHPKKQYTQQQQQQHFMEKAAALQKSNDKNCGGLMASGGSNGQSQPPPPQLIDQSRREQMHLVQQQQQNSMTHIHGISHSSGDKISVGHHPQPPRLEVKNQQQMPQGGGGRNLERGLPSAVLDDTSGLLRPADFSQPYPSCASPPAHNSMFEGDSSSADSFFTGLGNIVPQTSPNNTNSGSNSGFATGGSGTSRGEHQRGGGSSSLVPSPPETHHNLSPPQPFVSATGTLAASHFAAGGLPPLLPPTAPYLQMSAGLPNQPSLPPVIKQEQQQVSHLPRSAKVEPRSPGVVQSTEQEAPPPLATHMLHDQTQSQYSQASQQGLLTSSATANSISLLADLQQQVRSSAGVNIKTEIADTSGTNVAVDSMPAITRSSAPVLAGHRVQGESKHTLGSAPKLPTAPTLAAIMNSTASKVADLTTAVYSKATTVPIGSSEMATNAAGSGSLVAAVTTQPASACGGWQTSAALVKAEDDSQSELKKKEKKEKKEKRHKDRNKEKDKDYHDRGDSASVGGDIITAGVGAGEKNKEKKKKKKKDKDKDRGDRGDRDNHHNRSVDNNNSARSPRSLSRSPLPGVHSSPPSAARPREPVVQVDGTKLKIKLIPPKPTSTVVPLLSAGASSQIIISATGSLGGQRSSESDSNHGNSSTATTTTSGCVNKVGMTSSTAADSNLRIKIPIDKLDAGVAVVVNRNDSGTGSSKEKRKRRTEDLEESQNSSTKSRKLQHC